MERPQREKTQITNQATEHHMKELEEPKKSPEDSDENVTVSQEKTSITTIIPASTGESNSVVKSQTATEGKSTQTEGPTSFVLVHFNDTEQSGMVVAPADITVEHLRGIVVKLISYGKNGMCG